MSKVCAPNWTFCVKAEPIKACSAFPLDQREGVSSQKAGYVWGKISNRGLPSTFLRKTLEMVWVKGSIHRRHLQVHNYCLQLHLK